VRKQQTESENVQNILLVPEDERKLNFFAINVQFLVATTFDGRNKSFQKLFSASVSPSHGLDAFSYGPAASRINKLVDKDSGEKLPGFTPNLTKNLESEKALERVLI
jgi:hypothetical protein